MAANSNYQDGEKRAAAQQARLMHICPACGQTVDISRRYCNCHASLNRAADAALYNPPDVGPCNFETENLNCSDCPEDCMYCASFGDPVTNNAGYGGKDCQHRFGSAKCYCCQAQIDLGIDFRDNVNFSQLARDVLERRRAEGKPENAAGGNVFLEAANIIRELREEPVLNRIKQKWERAG